MRFKPVKPKAVMKRNIGKWKLFVGVMLSLCIASCRQHTTYSLQFPDKKQSTEGSVNLVAPELPALALPDPNRLFDWSLLDLDGFYPPGCEKIEPNGLIRHDLAPHQNVRFPTTERCVAPNGRLSLVHDGWERRKKKVLHWLLLFAADESVPKSVFGTEHAFEVLWAPDSEHFVITHYPGSNRSEVLAISSRDISKQEIGARASAVPYFVDGISERSISKAYRWTKSGKLIVRGLSRSEREPYDLVGFEVLVDVKSESGRVEPRFLRGFVCRDR